MDPMGIRPSDSGGLGTNSLQGAGLGGEGTTGSALKSAGIEANQDQLSQLNNGLKEAGDLAKKDPQEILQQLLKSLGGGKEGAQNGGSNKPEGAGGGGGPEGAGGAESKGGKEGGIEELLKMLAQLVKELKGDQAGKDNGGGAQYGANQQQGENNFAWE